MPRLIVISRDGMERVLDAEAGQSVMQTLRDAGHDELLALCGGCRSCATCHVYVEAPHPDRLPEMTEEENDLLDCSSHRQDNSRLSCQIRLADDLGDLQVTIAPEE